MFCIILTGNESTEVKLRLHHMQHLMDELPAVVGLV